MQYAINDVQGYLTPYCAEKASSREYYIDVTVGLQTARQFNQILLATRTRCRFSRGTLAFGSLIIRLREKCARGR